MVIESAQSINLFCNHCKRLWYGRADSVYTSGKEFDRSNSMVCPWCGHSENVIERPEHRESAVNSWAVPATFDAKRVILYLKHLKRSLSSSEVASLLKVNESVVLQRVPSVRVGDNVIYSPQQVAQWLESTAIRKLHSK
jgi:hypothetical protein